MTVGQRIKNRRRDLGISADELAARIGKNRSTVYRYENGDIDTLPLDVLSQMAEALETTPKYLMGWTLDCYDYERDPEGRLIDISPDVFRHLMSVHQNDPEAVWNAYLRSQEPDEIEWPAVGTHDELSDTKKALIDYVQTCSEKAASRLLAIVQIALADDE
jgi:transcriptional regulator with XRE-family HTH domain